MKERGFLFLAVWIGCLGFSLGLIVCGLFLFPISKKVYDVVRIDAGPIMVTEYQQNEKSGQGRIAASRVREIREWAVRVPKYAVSFIDNQAFVTLFHNGNPYDQKVEIGGIGDEYVEIVSGASFGDIVVTRIK